MNDVLLGQSYYLHFDAKLAKAMQPYPPLGTLYAASYLRSRGYTVALFDAMLAESEREWEHALDADPPRFAVLFEDNFNYLSKMCLLRMRRAAFAMIAAARERGHTVVVAGADAGDHADLYLEAGADFVIIGEGEVTLAELLDRLRDEPGAQPHDIAGLAFTGLGGEVVRTPPRGDLRDLDALPFPAWDLVDVERYRSLWVRHHGRFVMNVVTTRGCPYHCNWCAKPIWGQRYNARSPENVVAEMEWLQQSFRPDGLTFVDDIFGLQPHWLARFAELVNGGGCRLPFRCLSRADLILREGDAAALRAAGAEMVWIGAESGSQRVLDAMEKGIRVEQIAAAARLLHAEGIRVGFFLQFGYPNEGRDDIDLTRRLVADCAPDDIGISVAYPMPGTPFYESVRDQLGVKQNWLDSNDLAMLYGGPYSTGFYRQLHRVVHREFRMRKGWAETRRLASDPRSVQFRDIRKMAGAVAGGILLPVDRWKLRRLEREPRGTALTVAPKLDPEAAAIPSQQAER